MKKLINLVLAGFIFLFNFNLAQAGVTISEVKILPTEDRFIKLYNQDSSEVDLTNWYIQRKTQNGTSFNSLVTKTYFENKKISANGYFLISRNKIEDSDIVVDDLTLTESNVIQLKNSSGEVVNRVCWGDVDNCDNPNPASGQSIKMGQNVLVDVPAIQVSAESVSSSVIEPKTKITEIPKIKTQITGKSFIFTGFPIAFKATTFGYNGEQLHHGKYFWNFGDGGSKEIKLSDGEFVTHAYFYPGDYVVSLDYYQNYYSDIPDAFSQIAIKIIEADVSISRVGDEKDFFVELLNNTDHNADLSNWLLVSDEKSFIIPRNTILAAKKKMIISPKITNFSIIDKNTLKLMTPQREIVFDYVLSNIPEVVKQEILPLLNKEGDEGRFLKNSPHPNPLLIKERGQTAIPTDNLLASAVSSDIVNNNIDNSSSSFFPIVSFIFIGSSAYAVYFIRRKKITPKDGDDFEILDE